MTSDPSPMLEVGRITKPHGLSGQVLVSLTSTETSRLSSGSQLRAGDRDLVVEQAEPHQHRWIVRFTGVSTREDAESLAGRPLFAPAKPEADDGDDVALWVHELIGARVVDDAGTDWGPVVAVVANPASDLLELASGALVPLRFVVGGVEAGPDGPRVRVEAPPGLLG
jgi:16S rRNA processing protein RimM